MVRFTRSQRPIYDTQKPNKRSFNESKPHNDRSIFTPFDNKDQTKQNKTRKKNAKKETKAKYNQFNSMNTDLLRLPWAV